ncbi:adenine-specific DNA-methyltransferase [Ectothiorhodospira mobilis]|uniref:site-specific DNA-methyltransferase (adenine-specific) n=1 Tax=Ectothiorhodospira mobilis TaxID=195064 RepID=A0A1I4PD31_ECTMO|nr:site-specific DNA-methyltransferase [Ectothiorhodospira mobilis]SFM25436.1 adenine-specific DNA-methyltransferase [Ectothiorhodospira mobilis]
MAHTPSLRELILRNVPEDGRTIGNARLLKVLADQAGSVPRAAYEQARDALVQEGILGKGRGRGGSVYLLSQSQGTEDRPRRAKGENPAASGPAEPAPTGEPIPQDEGMAPPDLTLEMPEIPPELPLNGHAATPGSKTGPRGKKPDQAQVLSYRHEEKRRNNPHVGMVDATSDGVEERATWAYDPHLAPELRFDASATRARVERLIDDALASGDQEQMRAALEELKRLQSPYLQWTGKAEGTTFQVDTVSLHVHERIDPATILGEVQKRMKSGKKGTGAFQPDLFHAPFENLPLREAIDFYKHERDWANRLIAGDSLLVMNSMLQKEGMAGQVQMIYIDPPYGIKYGSNFQPFTHKRDVKDRKDEDLTQEPEMIKAFRDTWELGIHSYLTYLRDRLLLARELLSDSGSVFVQIGDENLHRVRALLDEIFGYNNFSAQIAFKATDPLGQKGIAKVYDHILWYGKNINALKFRQIYKARDISSDTEYRYIDPAPEDADRREKRSKEYHQRVYRRRNATSSGFTESCIFDLPFQGKLCPPPGKKSWSSNPVGMDRLKKSGRLFFAGKDPYYKQFQRDFPMSQYENCWTDKPAAKGKAYVVETAEKFIERCLLMATDPGDLVLDPTCGSGTTAYVAEKWGRRWVTCDTSRVAVTLAKQRLMTASYDYYELKYPQEGLGGGFIYKTVPHITLKSIANNPEIDELYEQHHPAIEQALAKLNQSLKGEPLTFTVTEGGRKGDKIDFSAPDSKTVTLPSRETAQVNALLEWEVPFDFPEDWPETARIHFDAFHKARQAMQRRMDESIANHADQEVLYDQPEVSRDKLRITGPFTVEAVPFATVLGLDEAEQPREADVAVARSGATSRHAQWREELLKAGIRGKGGQHLKLMDLETLPGAKYLHAVGTVAETGERVAVSFGPEYAALEQRQVEIAKNEAGDLFPLPRLLVFCAFTFDPEAAKDIDSIRGIQALKVQMNTDLLTEDLKKNARSNESFWLMGQPDVEVHELKDGKLQVEVHGFDYFDTKTGELKSGGKGDIAVWELDTDYDDRSLYPRQVFFPMAGKKDGWYKLKKDIRAELNEELLGKYHGTKSLPFEPGENRCIAVKIIDNRGIESLKVVRLD